MPEKDQAPLILVVDDDPALLSLSIRLLKKQGYRTAGAATGEDGLRQVRELRPDLVLLDVNLPGMDGLEVCRQIKADPELAGTFILILSAISVTSDSQVAGLMAGADGYIVWPVHNEELVARIEAMLRIKRVEDRLRESDALYQALMETSQDAIAVMNLEGHFLAANQPMLALHGFSSLQEFIESGLSAIDLVAEEDRSRVLKHGLRLREGQVVHELVYRARRKDGVIFRNRFTASLIRDARGSPAAYLIVGRKHTHRDQTEDTLKLEEARLKALLELSQRTFHSEKELIDHALEEMVRLTGSQIGYFHFVKEDQANLELYTWSREVLKTCTAVVERHYSLDLAGVWADCARLKRPVVHNDYQNLAEKKGYPQGHSHIVRHMSAPVLEGGKVRAISGVANKETPYDETDVLQLQLFLEQVWKIILRRRSESHIRVQSAALEAAANVIVITDKQGNITWVNPAFTQLTGYALEETVGGKPSLLKSGRHADPFYRQMWETILAGKVWQGELVNRRKDGTEYYEEMTITPVRDLEGIISHFIAVKQDVTRRKQAEEAERQARLQEETLRQAVQALTAELDLDQVLDTTLVYLGEIIPYEAAFVILQENDEWHLKAGRGAVEGIPLIQDCLSGNCALIEALSSGPHLFSEGETWLSEDCHCDIRPYKSGIGLLLRARGRAQGFLGAFSGRLIPYSDVDARRAQIFADQAAVAIENARLYEHAVYLSETDPLTGLYNRRHFSRLASTEFERSRRYVYPLSVITLDIDGFKKINDLYGHDVGDQALCVVADRLRSSLRSVDITARTGGEEFVAMLPETDLEKACLVSERVRTAIAKPMVLPGGEQIQITVSLGVAILDESCTDLNMLLKRADQALYVAKDAGKDRVSAWQG
jgi:diguanylate cyclase (GGDEF)-like protein/PAS domain S-box-containing protein